MTNLATNAVPELPLWSTRWPPRYTTIPSIILAGILVCVLWLTYNLLFSPISKIPGPWYTKLSGFFVMYHDFCGTKRLWIHNLHLRHGSTVRLGPNEVSFVSRAALREIHIAAGGYVKTELYSLFLQDDHRNLFTIRDHKEHNMRKKLLADLYTNIAVLRDDVQTILRERAEAFLRICAENRTIDIYLYLHCYALDSVSAFVFHPYGTKSIDGGPDNEIVKQFSYQNSRLGLLSRHYVPWLEHLYRTLSPKPTQGQDMMKDYAWSSIRKTPHSSFTLAARLLEHPEIDESDIVAECLDHIGAGIETTGDTLCFLMWELSQPHNMGKMQRLCEELQTCDPAKGSQLESLPYLNAMIEESLRLWSPGTLPLPRHVPQGGRLVDGHYIPGGVIVSTQSYTLHRFDHNIFPQPDTFLPERWLEEKGNVERQRVLFAFGAGARVCIGKFLALSEMRLLLHSVYSRYRTRPAADMHASMEMSDQVITSRPKDLLCKLTFEPLD